MISINTKYIKYLTFLFLSLFVCFFSKAQTPTDTTDLTDMSLKDLMEFKSTANPSALEAKIGTAIKVGAANPLVSRSSPAILSIMTSEEIQRSGARDLTDVLNTIPGFDFGVDVTGSIGLGIRGNWANEGKALLLLDGQELNEIVYGTIQFNNSFPLDNIKRIEIIRGPGSVIYGGAAEYAVINIVTMDEKDFNGIKLSTSLGTLKNTIARNNYSLMVAKKIKNVGISFGGFYGFGNRSDQPYKDIFGISYSMANNSFMNSLNLNTTLSFKGLSIKVLYLYKLLESRDGYDLSYSTAVNTYFTTLNAEAKYAIKLSKKFTLTPKLTFKNNDPWRSPFNELGDSLENEEVVYRTLVSRYKLNITSVYDISKNSNLLVGTEGFFDVGHKFGEDLFNNGKQRVTYFNGSVFGQLLLKNKIANLTLGARYEYNNSFGDAFVPRVGLTKRFDKFNFKMLYSQSFKAPTIENVQSSLLGKIMPEKTSVTEFEVGYQLNKSMFLTTNLFHIATKNTIVYVVDTAANAGVPDGYINSKISGSEGLEIDYKVVNEWINLNIGYSFYYNHNHDIENLYRDPLSDRRTLGFGANKITFSSTFNLKNDFFISPSLIYKSKKTAITSIDINDEYIYSELPQTYSLNLFFKKDNFLVKSLNASFGAYNILNQKIFYAQPYSSGHAPLPGLSRELYVRLSYKL